VTVVQEHDAAAEGFAVSLAEFKGPLDLLLSLIAKRRLELTELALHQVTDDFIAHIRAQGEEWDLDETTEFLVIAATLLDLKAARLLPGNEEEDSEDLALLEARDLLFARLLQYRAYKEISGLFDVLLNGDSLRRPRTVGLDPGLSGLLPDVELDMEAAEFAALAVRALTPQDPPRVSVDHVHTPMVSVREQAAVVMGRLRAEGSMSFRALAADCPDTLHVVARFLALLELFRDGAVDFDQATPLGELLVRWTARPDSVVSLDDEFDDEPSSQATSVGSQ